MTKEELEKEAKEKYHNHKIVDFQGFYNHHYYYLGYVDSAEPREKQIAELEDKLANADYQLEGRDNEIAKLEKENAELKRINDNLEKDRLAHIELEDRLKKDNAELKLKLEALDGQTPWKDIKDKSEVIEKLTKGKEIIEKLRALYLSPIVTKDDVKRQDEILAEAEAFLNSEVEK